MHEPKNRAGVIQSALRRAKGLAHRPVRDAEGCFWIEGIRNFVQAFDARIHFEVIVYSPILLKSDCAEMLSRRLCARGVRRLRVSPEQFRRFSTAPRASGIGAIVRQHWTQLDRIALDPTRFVIVVEQIRSSGNLGTILRTAEASGAAGVLLVGPQIDPFDANVVRPSMGGIFHVSIVRTSVAELRGWARGRGVSVVGLSPRAQRLWTELPDGRPIAFVLGEERSGLSEALRGVCDFDVRLPIVGYADSLNVSVAAGVAMYEMVRRHASAVSPPLSPGSNLAAAIAVPTCDVRSPST